MILNVWSISAIFLAGVGAALALAALAVAGRGLAAMRRHAGAGAGPAIGSADLDVTADRAHLLAMILVVLFGVRAIAWPHFYLLLESYVPDLASYGVMCAFGVTLIQPALVTGLEWAKPVLLLGGGLWFVMTIVDREAGAPRLLAARTVLAIPLALAALAECAGEIAYVTAEKVGRPVTCCTQFLDTDAAAIGANLSPLTALDAVAPGWTIAAYFAIGAALTAAAVALACRRGAVSTWPLALVAAGGAVNLIATHWVWVDVLAPRVLGLPYHHCVYELITDTPALGPAAMLAIGGSGGLAWPLALHAWRGRAPAAVAVVQRRVLGACAVALASVLVIVAVHLG